VLALNDNGVWRATIVPVEIINGVTDAFNAIPDDFELEWQDVIITKDGLQLVIEDYLLGKLGNKLPRSRDKQFILFRKAMDNLKKEIEKINCK
jgi:hypothetical protein